MLNKARSKIRRLPLVLHFFREYPREVRKSTVIAADWRSARQIATDLMWQRVGSWLHKSFDDAPRTVNLQGDIRITYRSNPGDIWTFREIWIDEIYKLPIEIGEGALLDLGANIGLATVWLARQHQFTQIICVEPSQSCVPVLRKNLEQNRLRANIIAAAVGDAPGITSFVECDSANASHVVWATDSESGAYEVLTVSMDELLTLLQPLEQVSLLKVDIEGSEEALLSNSCRWLNRVDGMVVEFHHHSVSHPDLCAVISRCGFVRLPMQSYRWTATDAFSRWG